jgi:flap endonuclease-1
MGVDISSILNIQSVQFKDLNGKVIAIDAYNALYQFLSIIRQADGTPLKDSAGRITSHISGLFYRTSNILEFGIKPVYVFDGKPPELKRSVIEKRNAIRNNAEAEWKSAMESGNLEEARKWSQQSSRVNREVVEESKRLLDYMGIAWIQAPSEGEAQASYMARKGDAYGVGSQDYDSLLFNTPYLLRNLTVSGKRKMPGKKVYKDISPEMIDLAKNLKILQITREQLVDMGILIGTDFNEGIKNIGPKKALLLIKKYGNLENIEKEKGFKIENYEQVRSIFLNADIIQDYKIEWKQIDDLKLAEFLCEEHDFSRERVSSVIEKLKMFQKNKAQKDLSEWL